jgi:hypothetical protein
MGDEKTVRRQNGFRLLLSSWPIPKQHYKHHFSLTERIIFHKLTIIPSINPTSLSTFPPKKLLFCQSLSSTKLESLFKYRPARLSSTPSQFTDRGLIHIVHGHHLLKLCRSQTAQTKIYFNHLLVVCAPCRR